MLLASCSDHSVLEQATAVATAAAVGKPASDGQIMRGPGFYYFFLPAIVFRSQYFYLQRAFLPRTAD